MAKKMWLDPNTGVPTDKPQDPKYEIDPDTGTLKSGHGGEFAIPAFGLNLYEDVTGHNFGEGGGSSSGKSYSGSGPDPTKNMDMIIRSELENIAPGQPIDERMVQYVKNQLGDDPAKISAKDFRAAIDKWVQTNPQASQWASKGNPFASSQPGQMDAATMQRLLGVTQAYQKPYLDALQNVEGQGEAYFKNLLPSLPPSFQALVKSQIQGPTGILNLDKQVAGLLASQNPAAITNAYNAAYAGAGTTASANPISSTLQSLVAGATPKP